MNFYDVIRRLVDRTFDAETAAEMTDAVDAHEAEEVRALTALAGPAPTPAQPGATPPGVRNAAG